MIKIKQVNHDNKEMNRSIETPSSLDLNQRAQIFSSFAFIYEKCRHKGYLASIQNTFSSILEKEVEYAFSELGGLVKHSSEAPLVPKLVEKNAFTFKENLKVISNLVRSLIS